MDRTSGQKGSQVGERVARSRGRSPGGSADRPIFKFARYPSRGMQTTLPSRGCSPCVWLCKRYTLSPLALRSRVGAIIPATPKLERRNSNLRSPYIISFIKEHHSSAKLPRGSTWLPNNLSVCSFRPWTRLPLRPVARRSTLIVKASLCHGYH